jgi:hypothetical protein
MRSMPRWRLMPAFEEQVRTGRIVEGHGDLRPGTWRAGYAGGDRLPGVRHAREIGHDELAWAWRRSGRQRLTTRPWAHCAPAWAARRRRSGPCTRRGALLRPGGAGPPAGPAHAERWVPRAPVSACIGRAPRPTEAWPPRHGTAGPETFTLLLAGDV